MHFQEITDNSSICLVTKTLQPFGILYLYALKTLHSFRQKLFLESQRSELLFHAEVCESGNYYETTKRNLGERIWGGGGGGEGKENSIYSLIVFQMSKHRFN